MPVQDLLFARQQTSVRLLARVLRQHRDALPKPLPATAAADCLTIAKALIESTPVDGQARLKRLRQRVLRALLGYLQYKAIPSWKAAN
jgi:siderophore synthetase component